MYLQMYEPTPITYLIPVPRTSEASSLQATGTGCESGVSWRVVCVVVSSIFVRELLLALTHAAWLSHPEFPMREVFRCLLVDPFASAAW